MKALCLYGRLTQITDVLMYCDDVPTTPHIEFLRRYIDVGGLHQLLIDLTGLVGHCALSHQMNDNSVVLQHPKNGRFPIYREILHYL